MKLHTTSTFTVYTDYTGASHYKCDSCGESHHFRNEYLARQWANRHGHMAARTFCTCH